MTAYATTDDLESRWRTLSTPERAVAEVLLGDASLWLRTWFPDLDTRIAAGNPDAGVPKMIACAMVKRALLAADREGEANSQQSATMGPFVATTQVAFRNPEGNLYITGQERDALDGIPSDAQSMECDGT